MLKHNLRPSQVMLKHNLRSNQVMLHLHLQTRLAWLVTILLYAEIVLGAELRRPAAETALGAMDFRVWLKVLNAGLIVVLAGWLVGSIWRHRRDVGWVEPQRAPPSRILRKSGGARCARPTLPLDLGAMPRCSSTHFDSSLARRHLIGATGLGRSHLGCQLRLARVDPAMDWPAGLYGGRPRPAGSAGDDRPRSHGLAGASRCVEPDALGPATGAPVGCVKRTKICNGATRAS